MLSNALGRSTITAVTESQSRVRALDDSANVSRRSEERPLVSANELLRFPLDEVIILPEGQYPIRARHIRYYADRHFGPIESARQGLELPYPGERTIDEKQAPVRLSDLAKADGDSAQSILRPGSSGSPPLRTRATSKMSRHARATHHYIEKTLTKLYSQDESTSLLE